MGGITFGRYEDVCQVRGEPRGEPQGSWCSAGAEQLPRTIQLGGMALSDLTFMTTW